MTLKSDRDKINTMSIEERTARYIARRAAELRGERQLFALDEDDETYITRRIAELRGQPPAHEPIKDDPYISRRIAYLRATGK